jgi:hypothetical protein
MAATAEGANTGGTPWFRLGPEQDEILDQATRFAQTGLAPLQERMDAEE